MSKLGTIVNKGNYNVLKIADPSVLFILPEGYQLITDSDTIQILHNAFSISNPFEASIIAGTENSVNVVSFFKQSRERAMDFEDLKGLIEGIHNSLSENQGLIEAKSGRTAQGNRFIYSIVKSVNNDKGGVNYFLRMNIENDGEILEVNGSFEESGMTGIRESIIAGVADNLGICKLGSKEWCKDPFDDNYTWGIPKNIAEKEGLDSLFSTHALSMARELLLAMLENKIVDFEAEGQRETNNIEEFFVDECKRITIEIPKEII